MSVNKVILVGRLGQDPELNETNSGTSVCNMSLATSRRYDGEEHTTWHNVTAWGKTAENCAKYLEKGRQVYIEGRIEKDKWEDNEGNMRTSVNVVARNVQFLSGGESRGSGYSKDDDGSSDYGDSFGDDDTPF